jgi:hypothetical protein
MNTPTMSSGGDSDDARRIFAAAVRFTALVVVGAFLVLGLALLWVHGCKTGSGSGALAHCGSVRRNFLAVGPPLVLLLGGVWAFVRTIQLWRAESRWWVWQGAGWFLLALMLVVLFMTAPLALM